MTPTEQILSLARAYTEAIDEKRYSHAQRALTLLTNATRQLPSWLLPPVVEPAAEVERSLACGAQLTLRNEDGNLIVVVKDHDGEVLAPVLSSDEAVRLRADVSRVLAAMGAK